MENKERNIVLFASKEVGFRVLEFLHNKGYPLVFVVIGKKDDKNIECFCRENQIPYIFFISNLLLDYLRDLPSFSWLVNAWSPHYLPSEVLDLFLYRVNIHPSYAPYCLGNDNAAWAIMENRTKEVGGKKVLLSGVSLLEMTERIDEGAVWARKEVQSCYPINGKTLHQLLVDESAIFFIEKWSDIYSLKITPTVLRIKTKHSRLATNSIKEIDMNSKMKVEEFVNNVLANDFSPNYTSILLDGEKKYSVSLNIEEIKSEE